MNKLGQYNNDERSHYNFSFSDNEGKHVTVSFGAEPDYDLDIIFNEFKNFLIATGHDVEGQIGELGIDESEQNDDDDESYPQSWGKEADDILLESIDAMTQAQAADKFSMDHLPNNGWPFGGLTTADLAPLTVTNLDTNQTYAYKDRLMQNPTMSPITTQQIQAWSLGSAGIQSLTVADLSAWTVPAPGTAGSAKVNFK
jgi:hypothetical protein